ncbi:MAG TPA: deoxyribose-phosphate aldolase [Anaerolineaceae bacterium]
MIPELSSTTITREQLAKTIDHSLLKPELTDADVTAGCALAKTYAVASVCVKPCHVRLAAGLLSGSDVKVGTVIGFPHGSSTSAVKIAEARQALADGAVELDMVLNIGALRSGEDRLVQDEIQAIAETAHAGGAILKVIFENAYLTDEEKIRACRLSEAAGADFVKTSTGFAPTGATLEDIRLMRAHVSPRVQVKAAHGVRTLDALLAVIDAGAVRVGATATAAMLDEFDRRKAAEASR